MRWRRPRLRQAVALLIGPALGLVGCASSSPGLTNQTPVPPPPASAVEPLYPCELLTTAQMQRLHLIGNSPQAKPDPGSLTGLSCMWATGSTAQEEIYRARLLAPTTSRAIPVPPVAGLPTTDATPTSSSSNLDCVYEVTLSPNVTLWAEFTNIYGDIPNMNHQTACDKARMIADNMVQTYQARTQRRATS